MSDQFDACIHICAAATLDTGACLLTFDGDFTRVHGLDCTLLEKAPLA